MARSRLGADEGLSARFQQNMIFKYDPREFGWSDAACGYSFFVATMYLLIHNPRRDLL